MADPISDGDAGEILSLLRASLAAGEKSATYSALTELQERSFAEPSQLAAMARCAPEVLPVILTDVLSEDEDVAGQALKCLGFMVYEPTIIASFSDGNVVCVISSLVKLITTTKMKVFCNLGVWCIAIQQFGKSYLVSNLNSILMAVAYALDNPFGSLSITYEAMQVVIKLTRQLNEKMRELSDIWAPLIYRRLLSSDERERGMSERCLLKTGLCISSPPTNLSKVLLQDIEQRLLPIMMEMVQDQEKYLHTIHAWGWFIRLLGISAAKNKNLINEMLKIPARTFSSSEPKDLIASLVAWETMVDVFFSTQFSNTVKQNEVIDRQENEIHGMKNLLKSMKLIMTPLLKIFSRSRYELSVHSACFKLWRNLLFKLDSSIVNPSVMKAALEPVLEAIFYSRFNSRSTWLWSMCLDLLEDLVSLNPRDCNNQSSLVRTNVIGESMKDCTTRFSYWDFSCLEVFLNMNHIIVCQLSALPVAFEGSKILWITVLRIFRYILKKALTESEMPSANFEEVRSFIKLILKFIKVLCEDLTSKPCTEVLKDMLMMAIQFIHAVGNEFKYSKVDGSQYTVPLDLNFFNSLNFGDSEKFVMTLNIHSFSVMDNVSPMFYLIVVYYSVLAQIHLYYSGSEFFQSEVVCFFNYVFSWSYPYKHIEFVIFLLYAHGFNSENEVFFIMRIWKSFALVLKEKIAAHGNFKLMEDELDQSGRLATYWLLCYPLIMCYLANYTDTRSCLDVCADRLDVEFVGDVWKLLYDSANCVSSAEVLTVNCFCNGLCQMLVSLLMQMYDSGVERILNNSTFFSNLGEIVVHVVKKIKLLDSNKPQKQSSGIRCAMEAVSWFLRLSHKVAEISGHYKIPCVSRIFASMTHFIKRLSSKQDILQVIEVMSDDLVSWLASFSVASEEMQVDDIFLQLKQFWTKMLDLIKRELPLVAFDSSLLSVLSPLLEATIDHQCSCVSHSTIKFWNSTFGNQSILNYPQYLLPILVRMSKEGKIRELKRSFLFAGNSASAVIIADSEHPIKVPSVKQASCALGPQFVGVIKKNEHVGYTPGKLCMKRIRSETYVCSETCDGFNLEKHKMPFLDSKKRGQKMASYQDRELRKTESILKMLRRCE